MRKFFIFLLLSIFLLLTLVSAKDWYARPYTPAGYGTSDGMSYATAFNGIDNVKSIPWNSIQPGDNLYVCGFHDGGGYDYSNYQPRPMMWITGKSGTQANPITIRGDCPDDPGTIFGSGMQFNDGWTLHDASNNIYKRIYTPLPNNHETLDQAFERHKSAEKINGIARLNKPYNADFASWQQSSYYLDNNTNTLYYKPASGDANDYTFYVGFEYPNINFQGCNYIIVKNINLMSCNNPSFGCHIGIRESANHITIDSVTTRWAGANAAIGISNDTYITIKNSKIKDALAGIYGAGHLQHIVISNNEIYDLNQDGYYYKALTRRGDCHAIALQGGGNDMIIEKNHIHDVGGEGILWYYDPGLSYSMTNVIIRYNHVHHVIDLSNWTSWTHYNQRGIEISGHNLDTMTIYNNSIYYNIIHDIGNPSDDGTPSNQYGAGIRIKAPWNSLAGESWSVYNNVVYNVNHGFLGFSGALNSTELGFVFKNNIIMNPRTYHTYIAGTTLNNGIEMNNNIYYPDGSTLFYPYGQRTNFQGWQSITQEDANSRVADSLFVSPVTDFHLKTGSPAIDTGVNVGLTQDFEGSSVPQGSAPEIGAYESTGSTPPICAAADINCDNKIDITDLILISRDFGKTSSFNNAKCDTNNDNIVDIFDVVYVASRLT